MKMETLNHIPYEKIVEDFDKYSLDDQHYRKMRKLQWVITEKIHGAHLCIHTNGKSVTYAKRKEVISPDDDFFSYVSLKKDINPVILHLYSLIQKDIPGMTHLAVHGELFGGEYPHPEVKAIQGVQAIQTGIYYCPDIRFCSFDMAVISGGRDRFYIDFPRFIRYAQKANLLYTPPLFTGNLHDVLSFDINFESTIPGLLGLPSLGPGNKAEGVVIKPETEFIIDTVKGKIRPVIKRKIREFSEDNRYNQAQKWNKWQQKTSSSVPQNPKPKNEIIINETFIIEEIDPLVTFQRLDCVISKTGRLCKKNKPRILRSLIEDIMESLALQFPGTFDQLGEADKKKLYTIIKEKSKKLLSKENR
ncbi:MAG: hypothetical protein JXJ04_24860 [Spirochaetales bacterium]|nr:hypothetical protein [Spirochaetales bacterium]